MKPRKRSSNIAPVAACLALLCTCPWAEPARAQPQAPAHGGAATPAPALGELFVVTASGRRSIPAQKVTVSRKGETSYYRTSLVKVPAVKAPAKIIDASPVGLQVVKLSGDGLIFSWDAKESYFAEPIEFIEETHETIAGEVVRTPSTDKPGLYGYVEVKKLGIGIGEVCFVFRIVR